jgi:tight adherence protein B
MSGALLLAAFCLGVAALLLCFAGSASRALRERVLAASGRRAVAAAVITKERNLIARPRRVDSPATRASAWLGLAPGQLHTRKLPPPVVLAVAGGAGGVLAWQTIGMLGTSLAALAGLAGALALLRAAYMWELGRARDEAFRQIPDALGLMVRAVRAGLPVGEAVRSVAREMPDPTRAEFQRVIAETGIGTPLDKALWGVHERTKLREYGFLSVVIGLQSQTGGSLSEALDNLADIVRKRVAMVAKAKAMAGQARASAFVLAGLPIFAGAAVAVLKPGYLDVLFEPRGQHLLFYAIGMLATGMFIIRTMIRRSTQD